VDKAPGKYRVNVVSPEITLGRERRTSGMSIEELTKKFVALASQENISKAEHAEVRKLMKQLKNMGMSNNEISDLSGGKWSTSTVKFYTPGIKVGNPSPWQNAAALLNKAIAADLTLEDIGNAVAVSNYLEAQTLGLDEVVDFMQAASSFSMSFVHLIEQQMLLKEADVSPARVAEFLKSKKYLEGKGVSIDSIKQISELAGKFGDTQAVFEVLSAYGSLKEVEVKVDDTEEKLENIHEETASAEQKLQETQGILTELAKPLQSYQKALGLGFGEEELEGLAILADKFGGPKAVFQVLKGYVDYSEINNKVSQAQSELITLESEVNKLNTEYGHMAAAVNMCRTLISDYEFGLDAISTILSLAEKYGEPVNVLKSVEAFAKLKIMQEELARLKGEVAKRKELLAELEGKNQEALKQLESLSAIAMKTGAAVSEVQNRLDKSKHLHKVMFLINDPGSASYQEYGPLLVAVVKAILEWISIHEKHFRYPHNIKSTLQDLITELGGD